MAKASLSIKDAGKGSFGIQEGNVEIINAVCKVHQYPPNKATGVQGEPFACIQITFRKLDKDGDAIPDEQDEAIEFGIGKLEKFHPGLAKSADDEDPQDMGTEVDVEGNCIYAEDGAAVHKNSKWMRLADSMEAAGFKSEVLGTGYLPSIVGTKGYVKTIALPRVPGSTAKNEPSALVFDKITEFPYSKGGKGKAATGKAAPVKGAAPAKAAAAVEATGDDAPEVVSTAIQAIQHALPEFVGKEEVDRKKFSNAVHTKMMVKKVPVKLHKPVMALVKGDWGIEHGAAENLFFHNAEDDTLTFME